MTRLFLTACACLLIIAAGASPAAAADGSSYESSVVQDRKYNPTHELSVNLGVLPIDAFAKSITATGAYSLYFTRHFGWEIVQFSYSFHVRTGLSDRLANFDVEPTPFELLDLFATSNLVFKPVYWKGSVLNSSLIRGEWLFTLGGGVGWYTRSTRPGLSVGTGFRIFGSEFISFRLDARYLAFAQGIGGDQTFDVASEIWVGLGTSLTF